MNCPATCPPTLIRNPTPAPSAPQQRGDGRAALQITLGELGIKYSRSRPYHPQTCGKVERFHQTLKKHLRALPAAATVPELQHQIDEFLAYYNSIRPHRALRRRTPIQAFTDRPKAFPTGYQIPPHYRVRHDTIDAAASSPCATTAACTTSA